MPSNRGMSGARNLGALTSLMERSISTCSATCEGVEKFPAQHSDR